MFKQKITTQTGVQAKNKKNHKKDQKIHAKKTTTSKMDDSFKPTKGESVTRKHSKRKQIKQKMTKAKKQKLGSFLIGTVDAHCAVSKKSASAHNPTASKGGKNKRKKEKRLLDNNTSKKSSKGNAGNAIFARNRLAKKIRSS